MIMRRVVKAVFCMSLFLIVGCSHIPFVGKSAKSSTTVKKNDSSERKPLESVKYVEKGSIVDSLRLQKKQNIVIVPFTAGVGVEASDELDGVALMIIKGISDTFATDRTGKHNHFNILTAENAQNADLVVQGRVTQMTTSSKVSRWVLFKGEKKLGVEGKMLDPKTDEPTLIFVDHAKTRTRDENFKRLGYRIGTNIGRFILSSVK